MQRRDHFIPINWLYPVRNVKYAVAVCHICNEFIVPTNDASDDAPEYIDPENIDPSDAWFKQRLYTIQLYISESGNVVHDDCCINNPNECPDRLPVIMVFTSWEEPVPMCDQCHQRISLDMRLLYDGDICCPFCEPNNIERYIRPINTMNWENIALHL